MCSDHIVQFYEKEDHLYNILTSLIMTSLNNDHDAAFIVATEKHIQFIQKKLEEFHYDLDKKIKRGQLVFVNAEILLVKIMNEKGNVDSVQFRDHIGDHVKNIFQKFSRLWIFGELVNILTEIGRYDQALELEKFWSELQLVQPFTLVCGYSIESFKQYDNRCTILQSVCNAHHHAYSCHSPPSPSHSHTNSTTEFKNTHLGSSSALDLLHQSIKNLELESSRRKATEIALQKTIKLLSIRAQENLLYEQNLYRNLLSILPVGVYGASYAYTDEYVVNEKFCEISGLTKEEIETQGWLSAVHPLDRHQCVINATSPENMGKKEYRFCHKDGSIRWVTGEMVNNYYQGKIQSYVLTIIDITEKKHLEQEQFKAQKLAEEEHRQRILQAERHKQQQNKFVDALCHELRNPLNGIYGNMELLEMGINLRRSILDRYRESIEPNYNGDSNTNKNGENDNNGSNHTIMISISKQDIINLYEQMLLDLESVAAISTCASRQKVITTDVLNLSKLEIGKVVLQNVDFNLKNVFDDVTKMFEAQARRKHLSIYSILPFKDYYARGDPCRLSQVLVNLVANAVKFTEQGSILLRLNIHEKHDMFIVFRCSVEDTGMGISDHEQAILFKRFSQTSSSTALLQKNQENGGSGLGLYLSKKIIELMGGTIFVESAQGQGSKFIFTFKCDYAIQRICNYKNQPSISTTTTSTTTASNHSKSWIQQNIQTILIVEDNEVNRRMMIRILESLHFTCITAVNGRDALDKYTSHFNVIDLILMDIQMPVMDGITATLEIRKREAEGDEERDKMNLKGKRLRIPIIGISGNAREAHKLEAIKSGMDGYLVKPVEKKELYEMIEKVNATLLYEN